MINILKAIYSHLYTGQATDPHQAVGGVTSANVHRTLSLAADGSLNATVISGGGSSQVDDAAFTPAVSTVTTLGAFADDTAPDSVDEGDAGAVRMSLNRNLYVRIRDNAGNERGLNVDASGYLGVTWTQRLDSTNDGVNTIGTIATYQAAFAVVGAASGDVIEIIGSATTIVRVLSITISKPSTQRLFTMVKRSAAATGGTSANATLVPLDSGNAAATAVIKNYSADPTEGAAVGTIYRQTLATTDVPTLEFAPNGGQPVVLRGIAETLCINVDGATNFDVIITFIEQTAL